MTQVKSDIRLKLRVGYMTEKKDYNGQIISATNPNLFARNQKIIGNILSRSPQLTISKSCFNAVQIRLNDQFFYGIKNGTPYAINVTRGYSILPPYILGIDSQKIR